MKRCVVVLLSVLLTLMVMAPVSAADEPDEVVLVCKIMDPYWEPGDPNPPGFVLAIPEKSLKFQTWAEINYSLVLPPPGWAGLTWCTLRTW